jgi:hypothetical protein
MSILGILFLEEERAMIHRAAMAIWEREQMSQRLMLSFLIKSLNGITTPQDTEKI